ncbi:MULTISPECIES: hypothetical protein [unclassified Mesorhizobium]|uniref:hypothetical protein n=1 Tax=unclassified Mesorhizobium TaxID=325217 RepID=UPI003339E6C7
MSDPAAMSIADLVQFQPRIEAVTRGSGERFDLTTWEGATAWLAACKAPSSAELFHVHRDDIATLEAAWRAGVPFPVGRNAILNEEDPRKCSN